MHRKIIVLILGSAMTVATLDATPVAAHDRGESAATAFLVFLAAAVAKQNREDMSDRTGPDRQGDGPVLATHQDPERASPRPRDHRDLAGDYR